MNNDPLRDPTLKIERAKNHIEHVGREVRAFLSQKPYRMFEEDYSYRGQKRVKVLVAPRRAIPHITPLATADAVRNLRVSLDQLAHRLAERNGHANSTSTSFPFARDAQSFSAEAKRKIKKLDPRARAMIENLKPYKGGDDLLRSLHALDIADKHRIVVPVGSMNLGTNISKLEGPLSIRKRAPNWDRLNEKSVVMTMPAETYSRGNIKIRLDIVFRDVALEGRPVFGTLRQLADLVQCILATFKRDFF